MKKPIYNVVQEPTSRMWHIEGRLMDGLYNTEKQAVRQAAHMRYLDAYALWTAINEKARQLKVEKMRAAGDDLYANPARYPDLCATWPEWVDPDTGEDIPGKLPKVPDVLEWYDSLGDELPDLEFKVQGQRADGVVT